MRYVKKYRWKCSEMVGGFYCVLASFDGVSLLFGLITISATTTPPSRSELSGQGYGLSTTFSRASLVRSSYLLGGVPALRFSMACNLNGNCGPAFD